MMYCITYEVSTVHAVVAVVSNSLWRISASDQKSRDLLVLADTGDHWKKMVQRSPVPEPQGAIVLVSLLQWPDCIMALNISGVRPRDGHRKRNSLA